MLSLLTQQEKTKLREQIAREKKHLSCEDKEEFSSQLFRFVEQNIHFVSAKIILLYYSLADEVCTHSFIHKWAQDKTIILPVVKGNELELHAYEGECRMKVGSYHIMEPDTPVFTDKDSIELALVPGVAFDPKGQRLGRGKGYYDRLLPLLHSYNIGICFDLQMQTDLPCEPTDVRMDAVVTEKGFIFNGK